MPSGRPARAVAHWPCMARVASTAPSTRCGRTRVGRIDARMLMMACLSGMSGARRGARVMVNAPP